MIVVPFIPAHLEGFEMQKEQSFINKYINDPSYIEAMALDGYTGLVKGNPVIIAGMYMPHDHIGMAWAFLSADCKNHLLGATRAIAKGLNEISVPRIETAVRHDFKEGHRWAKMLGFKNETPQGMKNYGVDGETYDLYARV